MHPLQRLKDRIDYQKTITEDDIIGIRHLFMRQYGWMHKEEFARITIPEALSLLEQFHKEKEETDKEEDKMKKLKRK